MIHVGFSVHGSYDKNLLLYTRECALPDHMHALRKLQLDLNQC